jgi:hypothetical protein
VVYKRDRLAQGAVVEPGALTLERPAPDEKPGNPRRDEVTFSIGDEGALPQRAKWNDSEASAAASGNSTPSSLRPSANIRVA